MLKGYKGIYYKGWKKTTLNDF